MEEIEVPTEHLHEEMEHSVRHSEERWITLVALTAALLAVLAAVSSLIASHHANEAMIDQLRASDQWAYYQAKGIKLAIIDTKIDLLRDLGKDGTVKDIDKINRYNQEQKQIQEVALGKEESSEIHLQMHNSLAKCVTLFQIAIAVCAISALTRRKWLWFTSLALGIAGIILLIIAHV